MSKSIIVSIIFALILSVCILSIPKKELPTDAEWEAYLAYEEAFLEWRDTVAKDNCVYQIQHRYSDKVYYYGSLEDCKYYITQYEPVVGDCIIMPYMLKKEK